MSSCPSPIFIVGAPRSGTTLLATLLSSHPQIDCGPETHFFPYLEANYPRLRSVIKDAKWPEKATEFVGALTLEDRQVHDLFGIELQSIYTYLAARQPSLQALLESLTEQHMAAMGKHRWAEKTPNHILHVHTLRWLYPTARLIRIVRDPRDSALSIAAKLPWASKSPVECAYLVDQWYRQSHAFFEHDPLTYTLRYEDLVTHPQKNLAALCDFLQAPFDLAMLDTEAAAQHTAPQHETWKSQVGQGLDPSRCFAWKKQLANPSLEAISLICREMIEEFGYSSLTSTLKPIFSHYTTYRFAQSHSAAIAQLLQQGYLLVPCHPRQLPAHGSVLYCDVPIEGKNYRKSRDRFYHFCVTLIALRVKGVTIKFAEFCQKPPSDRNVWGKIAFFLLQRWGSKVALPDLDGFSLKG